MRILKVKEMSYRYSPTYWIHALPSPLKPRTDLMYKIKLPTSVKCSQDEMALPRGQQQKMKKYQRIWCQNGEKQRLGTDKTSLPKNGNLSQYFSFTSQNNSSLTNKDREVQENQVTGRQSHCYLAAWPVFFNCFQLLAQGFSDSILLVLKQKRIF